MWGDAAAQSCTRHAGDDRQVLAGTNLAVDERSNGEQVEDLGAISPCVSVAVLVLALICKRPSGTIALGRFRGEGGGRG